MILGGAETKNLDSTKDKFRIANSYERGQKTTTSVDILSYIKCRIKNERFKKGLESHAYIHIFFLE